MQNSIAQKVMTLAFLIPILALPALAAPELGAPDVLSQDQVVAAAAEVTAERYPNADDVLVDNYMIERYETNGNSVAWDDGYIKILTEKGRREHQSASLHFTLPYDTAEFTLMEIIKPDGTVVPIDVDRQSRVMVNPSQMSKNIFNPNQKVLQATLPGLEVGDLIHLISRRVTQKARVPGTWSDYQVFEYTSPIRRIIYEVDAPAELPLKQTVLRSAVGETVKSSEREEGNRRIHRWEVSSVPRMYAEPNMPALYTVVQRLLLSTIESWQDISKWYWNLSEPHFAMTDEMKQHAAKLVDGAKTPQEKIERVFKFVSQEIHYTGLTTEKEAPGYEPHDVRTTYENRYGVCRDKAALLVAMLREAGVPAYPVLIHSGPKKDEEVPQPYFNHAIVGAEDGEGGYILMDPTDESTADLFPAYLGNCSYLVARPDGEKLRVSPVPPATDNLVRINSQGRITSSGKVEMTSEVRFEGINDNAYRGFFARQKPEERRRFFEGRLKAMIPGARLTSFRLLPEDMQNTDVPLSAELSYHAPEFPIQGDRYVMLTPPWLGTGIGYVNFVLGKTGLQKRRFPLQTDITCGITETFELDLGESIGDVVSLPEYESINSNGVEFALQVTSTNRILKGHSDFLINAVEFSPEEYLGLKRSLKEMEYDRRKRPLFRQPDESDREEDARILADVTTIRFHDETNWTSTRKVRKKVLTYAGVKQHSEIKLVYNPAWEEVELISATVQLADGLLRKVAPEEVNDMDAGWVASAPRYPPAKIRVISLPGVESGSIIQYEVAYRNRNMPFFSLQQAFRGFDPIGYRELLLDIPKGMELNILDQTRGDARYSHEEAEGRVTHRWIAGNQDSVVREEALPSWWSFNPTVFASTGDWKAYANQVGEALEKAATGQSASVARAVEVAGDAKDPRDKARMIRDFVARHVRSAGPGLNSLPLSAITAADMTLEEGYGNTTDQAVLLVTMLRAIELDPEFVLTSSSAAQLETLFRPYRHCPQRNAFDQVLVQVKIDGDWIHLNDTDQYAALGATPHDGQPGLKLDGSSTTILAPEKWKNRAENLFKIDLDADGTASITSTRRYHGAAFGGFHRQYAELPPEERNRHYQELVAQISQSAVPEGELTTGFEEYPGKRSFTVTAERFGVRSGSYLYVTLPAQFGNILGVRGDDRVNPFYRQSPLDSLIEFDLLLPAETESVDLLPSELNWVGPGGLGRVTVSTNQETQEDGRILLEVRQHVQLEPAVVESPEYPQLLNLHRRLQHPSVRTVMVKLKQ